MPLLRAGRRRGRQFVRQELGNSAHSRLVLISAVGAAVDATAFTESEINIRTALTHEFSNLHFWSWTELLVKAHPDHILGLGGRAAKRADSGVLARIASTPGGWRGVRKWEWDCLAQAPFQAPVGAEVSGNGNGTVR